VLNTGQITANNTTAGTNPVGNNPGILAQSIGGGGGNGAYSFGSVDGAGVISIYVGGTGGVGGTASATSIRNSGVINVQAQILPALLPKVLGALVATGEQALPAHFQVA